MSQGYVVKEVDSQTGEGTRRGPRQMLKEVSRRRSAVAKLRKVVRNGELIRNQEHKARLMFVEKVKRLREMKSLE